MENWKENLHQIIFKSNTKKGKLFDIILLITILCSVLIILLDSVKAIHAQYGSLLFIAEWLFTLLFSIEYIFRVWVSKRKLKYVFSFFGLIDLLSILPAYLSVINASYQFLLVLRSLRLLRIFKIFQLSRFLNAGQHITQALYNSYRKILIFMLFIVLLVIIVGSVMYIVEENSPGFESIPAAIYWAVVTITTVGYGDVSPQTALGQFLSMLVMLCGYSIIAVPTGIVTSEMAKSLGKQNTLTLCKRCGHGGHRKDARYCYCCAEKLEED